MVANLLKKEHNTHVIHKRVNWLDVTDQAFDRRMPKVLATSPCTCEIEKNREIECKWKSRQVCLYEVRRHTRFSKCPQTPAKLVISGPALYIL